MFKITAYVNASEIWPTAENHKDLGYKPGLVRGYNIEVTTSKGVIDWMSCEYIDGDPEEVFNDDYHTWSRDDWGFTPTGRICFRGYGLEEYDFEERDTFIVPVNVDDEEAANVVENEIIGMLEKHPAGLRMRTIAHYIHKDPVKEVLPALYNLEGKGKVKSETYRDMANMEIYDKWFVC